MVGVIGIQVACFGWALGTSYSKRHRSSSDPLAASTVQMLFSGTMLLGLATANREWAELYFTARTLGAMVYLTIAGSMIAYTAYVYAVQHLPISTVALYAYVNPLIAVLLGTVLLGEPFSVRIVIAGALVLAGTAAVRGVQSPGVPPAPPGRADR
jgi:drug/metabolite transporter (DMT)-like permease